MAILNLLLFVTTLACFSQLALGQKKEGVSRAFVRSTSNCRQQHPFTKCCNKNIVCRLRFYYRATWLDRLDTDDEDLCKERCDCHYAECIQKCECLSKVKEAETSDYCKCVFDGSSSFIYNFCKRKCTSSRANCYSGCNDDAKIAGTRISWVQIYAGRCDFRDCPNTSAKAIVRQQCPVSG